MYHLCQKASKSVHSFSKYRVQKFGIKRTDERMDEQMFCILQGKITRAVQWGVAYNKILLQIESCTHEF